MVFVKWAIIYLRNQIPRFCDLFLSTEFLLYTGSDLAPGRIFFSLVIRMRPALSSSPFRRSEALTNPGCFGLRRRTSVYSDSLWTELPQVKSESLGFCRRGVPSLNLLFLKLFFEIFIIIYILTITHSSCSKYNTHGPERSLSKLWYC